MGKKTVDLSKSWCDNSDLFRDCFTQKDGVDAEYYLDVEAGDVIGIGINGRPVLDGEKAVLELDELVEEIKAGKSGRFIKIDLFGTQKMLQIMEDFINEEVRDEEEAERLRDAIHGGGAFGRFKVELKEMGLRISYEAYKSEKIDQMIKRWLGENEIDLVFKDGEALKGEEPKP